VKKKNKKIDVILVLVIGLLAVFSGCSQLTKLERSLPAEDREFLSTVRYVITKQERKIFSNLPAEERDKFKEEFWKKRDPDPTTEENEYKQTYFERIERANELFTSEGRNGWLTDRGRVYVLLGPPERRDVYPTGYSFYGPPVEVWVYGFFPIVFIDQYRVGTYKIEPLSAYHIQELTKAQMVMKPNVGKEKFVFDFDLKVEQSGVGGLMIKCAVPYRLIRFEERRGRFETELDLSIEASTPEEKKVFSFDKTYIVSLTREDLKHLDRAYAINETAELSPGNYFLKVSLKNLADDRVAEKSVRIKVK
jgi:GWxTD domain-containing protein